MQPRALAQLTPAVLVITSAWILMGAAAPRASRLRVWAEASDAFLEQSVAAPVLNRAPFATAASPPPAAWAVLAPTAGRQEEAIGAIGPTFTEFDACSVLTFGTVLDSGEDAGSARAIAAAGPMAAVAYHGIYEGNPADVEGLPGGVAWRAQIDAIPEAERHLALHEDHFVAVTDRDRSVVTGDVLRMFTWTDEAPALRTRLDALGAGGATEVLFAAGGPDVERELRAFYAMAVA